MKMFFVLITITTQTLFASLTEDFNQLKHSGVNFEPSGTICEEIARLRFAEKYPEPNFRVITGVTYSSEEKMLGELDLVVFDNATTDAKLIAEVKCGQNARMNYKKAQAQRKRFLDNIKLPQALKFVWLKNKAEPFKKTQFKKAKNFLSIAQQGTHDDGFQVELPYTLDELMTLRSDLMNCQASGDCTKPK